MLQGLWWPGRIGAGGSGEFVTKDRYGLLFPSDDHKAAMDEIAGELLG